MTEVATWPDLPPPLPWALYEGEAELRRGSGVTDGTALVWFTLRGKPEVRFEFRSGTTRISESLLFADFEPRLIVPGGVRVELTTGKEGEQGSGWGSTGGPNGFRCHGADEGLVGGDGAALDLLRIHLLNFGDHRERSPRQFEVDDWTIRITPTGTAPTPNGFAVTHVLDLVRSDHVTFGAEDARAPQRWLFDALAFATGGYVGSALAQGYRDGAPVYLEAKCTKADPWRTRRSWWDQRSLRDDELAELCTRWAATTADDRTAMLMRRAAGSYVSALTPDPLDTAVPVAGIGIELMVWELIHQRERLLSTDEFERTSFASRLRLALRTVGISAEVPNECSALSSHVAGAELPDGPYAVADVRNRLVHPPKKKRGWPPPDVMSEAWLLAAEYLALLILTAVGYEGRYRSQFDYSGYPGSEVPVPWSRQS